MKTRNRLFLPVLFLFGSCIKDDVKLPEPPELVNTEIANGLPKDPGNINGYLYASFSMGSISSYTYLNAYGSFRDPGGTLMSMYDHIADQENFNSNSQTRGNIRTSPVSIYGLTLPEINMGNSISYRLNVQNAANINDIPRWKTNGNGSFKPLDHMIPRGLPTILTAALSPSASVKSEFVIDTRAIVTNYDSLRVSFQANGSAKVKRVGSDERYITFSDNELKQLGTGSRVISYFAFNYSNGIIDNRVYLFELSRKYTMYIQVYN